MLREKNIQPPSLNYRSNSFDSDFCSSIDFYGKATDWYTISKLSGRAVHKITNEYNT